MTQIPRYRHACRGCGRNMLSNPKRGLCGDCEAKKSTTDKAAIDAASARIQQLETDIMVLECKDFFDIEDQARMVQLKGTLLSEYRAAWQIVTGKPLVKQAIRKGMKI